MRRPEHDDFISVGSLDQRERTNDPQANLNKLREFKYPDLVEIIDLLSKLPLKKLNYLDNQVNGLTRFGAISEDEEAIKQVTDLLRRFSVESNDPSLDEMIAKEVWNIID